MRDIMLNALKSYYVGNINRHIANVEVLLTNPTGIGEHQDIQDSIEVELGKIADYNDKLEMLIKYFTKPQQQEENKDDKKDKK